MDKTQKHWNQVDAGVVRSPSNPESLQGASQTQAVQDDPAGAGTDHRAQQVIALDAKKTKKNKKGKLFVFYYYHESKLFGWFINRVGIPCIFYFFLNRDEYNILYRCRNVDINCNHFCNVLL